MMPKDSPAETDQESPAPVDPSAGEAAETTAAEIGEIDKLDPYAALENERDRWKDLALRVQADFDNFRKRTAREVTEIRRFAASALLEDLLPVLDNFDLGLMAARQAGENSPISMGMAMVRRQLDDFLNSQGVKEIPTDGERFDPTRHDAVATEADAAIPEGTIIRVARKGYFLHDRVLRAPSVVVSSGPAAESPEPQAAD
ncbi:MAG: nucleotide exchange factor GrpE [Verrucomicrobiales bacterium]